MDITTVHNIGDNVFFLHDNIMQNAAIHGIGAVVNSESIVRVTYTILGIDSRTFFDTEVFVTLYDLVNDAGFGTQWNTEHG